MMKKIMLLLILGIALVVSVHATDPNVCCEKTISGLYCQDVPAAQCQTNSRQVPTACASTSYCKPGVCYDSTEGNCLDNTPQIVCNSNNGTWSETSPAQCQLGCCTLGDQAAFVSLVRCKRLSSFLGIQINYNSNVNNEVSCVLSVQNQDKGACVFSQDFEKTCKFTTRADCTGSLNGTSDAAFFKGKLCSAPELGTNCEKTTKTTCVPGKDEVYFVDSCGNPANIYDVAKVQDADYWTNLKDKSASCNAGGSNANSASCGNCNYPLGSYCRAVTKTQSQPTYGNNMCQDLNCYNTENGNNYKHGESWCVYDDKGSLDNSNNAVGSRFYKHICENGQEVLEQCADFRQEECIQSSINTTAGSFSQAACRVNRWQDCTAQTTQSDCENSDRRDCSWKANEGLGNAPNIGTCLPTNTPGINFWDDAQSKTICAQANAQCTVTFEKGLFGGEKCTKNCDCLDASWAAGKTNVCIALGDCGPKINWVGDSGYKPGFTTSTFG